MYPFVSLFVADDRNELASVRRTKLEPIFDNDMLS